MQTPPSLSGQVTGTPNLVLRAEGLAVLIAASAAYHQTGAGWPLFAVLFLAPDIFMLGYLVNRRIGAAAYNLGHTYLVPAAIAALGVWMQGPTVIGIALIWIAHIGFDRMVGYGLKYATGFKVSHLGGPATAV